MTSLTLHCNNEVEKLIIYWLLSHAYNFLIYYMIIPYAFSWTINNKEIFRWFILNVLYYYVSAVCVKSLIKFYNKNWNSDQSVIASLFLTWHWNCEIIRIMCRVFAYPGFTWGGWYRNCDNRFTRSYLTQFFLARLASIVFREQPDSRKYKCVR